MRASTADVGDLGVSVSLEDVWKIRPETPLADVCKIGIETSVAGVGALRSGTSFGDICRIGATTSLAGPRSGAQVSVACHVIGTEGSSPFDIKMCVPDNAVTEVLGIFYS